MITKPQNANNLRDEFVPNNVKGLKKKLFLFYQVNC